MPQKVHRFDSYPINGSCIIRVAHAFKGNTTGLTIYINEIINHDEQESHFND